MVDWNEKALRVFFSKRFSDTRLYAEKIFTAHHNLYRTCPVRLP